MNDSVSFPVQQFYEALMSPSGLQEKLENILIQFKRKNISMIYQSIVHIHQILISKLEPPLMKYNALNCARIFFNTCEYSAIILIQIYILPIIFQIAAFKSTKKSQEGLTLYFIERGGAQPTKQVKRIGFNYVVLAVQFIFASSQVKMYRTIQSDEMDQESNFKKIAKALKMRKVEEVKSYQFYQNLDSLRKTYIDKLSQFNPQPLIDYFLNLFNDQYSSNFTADLDTKRLIMFGDVYIISPLTNHVQDELNSISSNFDAKRKYLSLLSQLIHYGYIEAIILISSSEFLSAISYQISKVAGDKDLDQGRLIYPHVNDSQKSKKQFYLQFLRCVEIWAHAIPFTPDSNEQSDCKKMYQYLKYDKRFKFPDNPHLHKFKSQMQIYLKQNTERNQKIAEMMDNKSMSQKSRVKISSLQDQSKVKSKKTIDFQQLQENVINAMMILEVVGFVEKRYDREMKKLLNFKMNWLKNLETVKTNQADQPYNFQLLAAQGDIVYQQIVSLEKIYVNFKTNKISFEEVQNQITKVLNELNKQDSIISKSEVSISAKSRNTQLTNNKRDVKSKISQKVKNQKDLSDHSKVSQNKSAYSINTLSKSKKRLNFKKPADNKVQNKADNNIQNGLKNLKEKKFVQKTDDYFIQQKSTSKPFLKQKNNVPTQVVQRTSQRVNTREQESKLSKQNNLKNQNQFRTASFIPEKKQTRNKVVEKFESQIQKVQESFNLQSNSKFKNQVSKAYYEDNIGMEMVSPFSKKNQESDIISKTSNSKLSNSKLSNKSHQQSKLSKSRHSKLKWNTKESQVKSPKSPKSKVNRMLSDQKVSFANYSQDQFQKEQTNSKHKRKDKKQSNCISFNNGNYQFARNEASFEAYGFKQVYLKQSMQKQPSAIQHVKVNEQFQSSACLRSPAFTNSQGEDSFNVIRKQSQLKKVKNVGFRDEKSENINSNNSIPYEKINKTPLNFIEEKQDQNEISQVLRANFKEDIIKESDHSMNMLQSYYQTKEIQAQKRDRHNNGQNLNFKQIVQVNKQIIHTKNDVRSPSQSVKQSRMQKLFQFKNQIQRKNKKPNLMQVLSERNTKKCIQMYLADKQKNKMIQNLNLRIKHLQQDQRNVQAKLSRRDFSERQLSIKQYSQKHHMKFKAQQSNQASFSNYSKEMNNTESKQNSLSFKDSRKSEKQSRKLDAKAYQEFLQILDTNAVKKTCLKNKSLVVSNDQMEIGCMSIRKDKFINFTFFITPKVLTMKNVKVSIQSDQNLSVTAFPDQLYIVRVKKQQTINVRILIQNVPYKIPKLILSYQIDQLKSQNKHQVFQTQFLIPCSFNKMCSIQDIPADQFREMFTSKDLINSQSFKINTKIFKQEKIKEYFPYLTLVKKSNGKNIYACECNYNGNIFLLSINIDEKKHGMIEGKNMTGQYSSEKFLQFLISTFRHLIEAHRK